MRTLACKGHKIQKCIRDRSGMRTRASGTKSGPSGSFTELSTDSTFHTPRNSCFCPQVDTPVVPGNAMANY